MIQDSYVLMKTKLTLSVDKAAVERAKAVARRRRISVSSLVEKIFLRLEEDEAEHSLASRYRGSWGEAGDLKGNPRLDYLMEKHGKR